MIALIGSALSIISLLLGWWLGAARQKSKAKKERAAYRKALDEGDIDTLNRLLAE